MSGTEELRRRARAGDLHALQELRDRGFFATPRPPAEGYPVSHAQRRIWAAEQLGPGAYNIPIALELAGPLDPAALREALRAVIRRHEVLRTRFATAAGGALRQFVQEEVALPWAEHDLGTHPDAAQEARRIAQEHAAQPFDLARGPPLRAALLRLAPERHLFLLNLHHIAGDLLSLGILAGELSAGYAAGTAPAPLPLQYRNFAARQEAMLAGEEAARHRAYWLARLAPPLAPLDLPTDHPRPPLRSHAGARLRLPVEPGLVAALRRLGLRHGLSLFMVLAAMVALLLHRHTGQEHITLGFPAAGRDHPDLAGLIGCFVNTVPLRLHPRPERSVAALLAGVRQAVLEAYEHQAYPFDRLVEELDLPREMSRSPVFDVSVSLAHAGVAALRLGEAAVLPCEDGFAAAKLDLAFDFDEAGEGLELSITYATSLFAEARIRRMGRHLLRLAAAAAAEPEAAIGQLPLLTPEEEAQILRGFNDTRRPLPPGETVLDLFERQVARAPTAIALRCGGGEALSYAALDAQANRLARLLRARGLGPEGLVGVFLEPSARQVAALLGILKAGGTYLPLDPANPPGRLAAMLEDAAPALVLADPALAASLPPGCPVLPWDAALEAALADGAADNPPRALAPDAAAYAIFTSGSTGRPKAVLLPHRGLANVAREQARLFGPGPGDRVLQFAALGFDASVFETVMALAHGATLCLAPREHLLPGAALLDTLEGEAISIATLPPSTLAALPAAPLPHLRVLTVAGEACPAEPVRHWAPGRAFFNLYGPTEATIWATAARCAPDGRAPTLGRPIGNTRLTILDRQRQPVPVGVPGELCIAGVGLARGYLGRPELTAERFIPDPFEPGARLYRTGDLARWREDGEVEFLGRIDAQVKLRGYRIELGEVEAALARHPGVRDAVVLAREARPGEWRLLAWATPRDPASPPEAEALRQFLRGHLPDYMLPARILLLEAMPLTPNKKIDRAALPEPDAARPALRTGFLAPRDALEAALAHWFAEALRLERVGIHDNFFELGGDSLMATRLVSWLRDAFRAEITIPQLFRAGSVGALAEAVRAALPEGRADRLAAALRRLREMPEAEKQALLRQRAG